MNISCKMGQNLAANTKHFQILKNSFQLQNQGELFELWWKMSSTNASKCCCAAIASAVLVWGQFDYIIVVLDIAGPENVDTVHQKV